MKTGGVPGETKKVPADVTGFRLSLMNARTITRTMKLHYEPLFRLHGQLHGSADVLS